MKKITMGTGVGQEIITVDGIEVKPYGSEVLVYSDKERIEAEGKGWTTKSETRVPGHFFMVPPLEKYQCIEYVAGNPHCDGRQTLMFE